MTLSHFITAHADDLLVEWEAFARTLLPAGLDMPSAELRDPAVALLTQIVAEMKSEQSPEQQLAKSRGIALTSSELESPASLHGAAREVAGFELTQVMAEYRALRTTVLRSWLPRVQDMTSALAEEMLHFNEAIDQAMAQACATYTSQASMTRETALDMLEHDLKTPLVAIAMAADYLAMPGVGNDTTAKVGDRIKRSLTIMRPLVDEVLDYARLQKPGLPAAADTTEVEQACSIGIA